MYECQRCGVCVWYVCDVLYAVLYVRVSCFVVCGCTVSRRYINVCNCDMFCVVNVYLYHLKFCVMCIHGRRYVCCSECNVVSDECNEPTSCLVQPIGTNGGEVMYFGSSSVSDGTQPLWSRRELLRRIYHRKGKAFLS